MALDPRNLSDTILDSWDSHSDKILSNDQFKDELEKEKQEKAELQEMLGTNRYAPDIFHCDYKYFLSQHQIFFIPTSNIFSLDTSPESSDSFPLKSPPRCPAPPPRCPPSRRIVLRPAEHQGPRKQHHHSSTPPAHPKHSRSPWTTSPCLQVTTHSFSEWSFEVLK